MWHLHHHSVKKTNAVVQYKEYRNKALNVAFVTSVNWYNNISTKIKNNKIQINILRIHHCYALNCFDDLGCSPFQVVYVVEILGLLLVSTAETCMNIEYIYGFCTAETKIKYHGSASVRCPNNLEWWTV